MESLYDTTIRRLEHKACEMRKDVIRMVSRAGSGHVAGALGMADIFSALYFHILRHNPKNPSWEYRDRVILSNGHICPILYSALAHSGYFHIHELETLRKIDSRLQGHPHRSSLPGVETTSGPLGCGLSQAAGMALAGRMDGKKYRVYCIMSDAEHQEGNTWEAAMFIGKNKLSNVIAIVDRNGIQIGGNTEDVMPLEPLTKKYASFGWHVEEICGHNFEAIVSAVATAQALHEKPTVIIAHTIPGRGVGYMENNYVWHGVAPGVKDIAGAPHKKDQEKEALKDLNSLDDIANNKYLS